MPEEVFFLTKRDTEKLREVIRQVINEVQNGVGADGELYIRAPEVYLAQVTTDPTAAVELENCPIYKIVTPRTGTGSGTDFGAPEIQSAGFSKDIYVIKDSNNYYPVWRDKLGRWVMKEPGASSGGGGGSSYPDIRGTLNEDLHRLSWAEMGIFTVATGGPNNLTDSLETKIVYSDRLISTGYKLATGTWVVASYAYTRDVGSGSGTGTGGDTTEDVYYVTAANPCEVPV